MTASQFIKQNSQGRWQRKLSGRRKRIAKARRDAKTAKLWAEVFMAAFGLAKELENPTPRVYTYEHRPYLGKQYVRPPADPEMAATLRNGANKIMEGLALGRLH